MLKIRALMIDIKTKKRDFQCMLEFGDGLNIIYGDNRTGKSTCINAIFYTLGLEELLGGKNGKTMKPVLREEVEVDNRKYKVIETDIFLEIENEDGKLVTIKRNVKGKYVSSKLVTIYMGAKLTGEKDEEFDKEEYYLHDAGSAVNQQGFFMFLEKFIGIELPSTHCYNGKNKKLYIQTIFAVFFIEQIRGWKDFLATVPSYYGIRNVNKRVIEFILNLDVLKNEKIKNEIESNKREIATKWQTIVQSINNTVNDINGYVCNLPNKPSDFEEENIIIKLYTDHEKDIRERKRELKERLIELELQTSTKVGEKVDEYKIKLEELEQELIINDIKLRELKNRYGLEKMYLDDILKQKEIIKEDLIKNKDALKLSKLGSNINIDISKMFVLHANRVL